MTDFEKKEVKEREKYRKRQEKQKSTKGKVNRRNVQKKKSKGKTKQKSKRTEKESTKKETEKKKKGKSKEKNQKKRGSGKIEALNKVKGTPEKLYTDDEKALSTRGHELAYCVRRQGFFGKMPWGCVLDSDIHVAAVFYSCSEESFVV